MRSKITLILLFVSVQIATAQIVNEPPYILTIAELKAWTQNGPTADPALISTVDLATRFENADTQFKPELSNDMRIAYLPDGMNNFGNYSGEQSQFNLYNFTNWAYIDQLVWFGGTASQTVQLPSAPWANAAHKNGVKVLGNVFFAPNAFGGSTATVLDFLEQDGNGDFIVIPIMVDIMEYYNFDGWFVNQETNTTPAAAQLMYEFLRDLTTEVEAAGKEVMWYDAMTLSGSVGWQNRLNTLNSPFVQNDEDNNGSFEQRVSSTIFINFFWNTSSFPSMSRSRANTIGRSSFEVFTGVDVWPGRNQAPFQSGGNNWMSLIHENPTTPYTSLGLFAPNCVYNNAVYSNFNTDPNDYEDFYSAERHMFSGADRNPALEDPTGFKGYANWIPAGSTITELPFETNFNTGHGLSRFTDGVESSTNPWHNMDEQDLLPTWQFAFSEDDVLSARWDFDNAWNGGSSLRVEGDLPAGGLIDMKLYKTQLTLTSESKIDLVFDYDQTDETQMRIILTFADNPTQEVQLFVAPGDTPGWFGRTLLLDAFAGRELATVGLRFISTDAQPNYAIHIGNLKVHDGTGLGIDEALLSEASVLLTYPRGSTNEVLLNMGSGQSSANRLEIYSLNGSLIRSQDLESGKVTHAINTQDLAQGMYMVQVIGDQNSVMKKMVVR